jgi:hypothetical protein
MTLPNVNNENDESLQQGDPLHRDGEEFIQIYLDGDLDISSHIQEKPYKPPSLEEQTRSTLALWLVKCFGCSLGSTILLMSISAFNPNVDKTFIRDFTKDLITPQITLVAMALGYYFGIKQEEKN